MYYSQLLPAFKSIFCTHRVNGALNVTLSEKHIKESSYLTNLLLQTSSKRSQKSCSFTVNEMFQCCITNIWYIKEINILCQKGALKFLSHDECSHDHRIIQFDVFTKSIYQDFYYLYISMKNAKRLIEYKHFGNDFMTLAENMFEYNCNGLLLASDLNILDQHILSQLLSVVHKSYLKEYYTLKHVLMAYERRTFLELTVRPILQSNAVDWTEMYEYEKIECKERFVSEKRGQESDCSGVFESIVVEKNTQLSYVHNLPHLIAPIMTINDHILKYCNPLDQIELKCHSLLVTLSLIRLLTRRLFSFETSRTLSHFNTHIQFDDNIGTSSFVVLLQSFTDRFISKSCMKTRLLGQFTIQYYVNVLAAEVQSAEIGLNAYIPADTSLFMNLAKRCLTLKNHCKRRRITGSVHLQWIKVLCHLSRWFRIFEVYNHEMDSTLIDILPPMIK